MIEISTSSLVSVIMPAYNAAQYIAEAIGSVINQTYPHWELIVVDDGSTDSTRTIVQQYCEQDVRIHYIHQANARQGRARNNGIQHAAGSYIAFLDSDDLWLPQKLTVQLERLQATSSDLIFSDAYAFTDSSELVRPGSPLLNSGRGFITRKDGLKEFLSKNPIPILTVLVKREILIEVGGFTENRLVQNAEDYHLWIKLLLSTYCFYGMQEPLAAYRVHPNSVSSGDGLNLFQVVEAKAELIEAFPADRETLYSSLRTDLNRLLCRVDSHGNPLFFKFLRRCLVVTGHKLFQVPLVTLQWLGLRKLALRSTYFVLNHL